MPAEVGVAAEEAGAEVGAAGGDPTAVGAAADEGTLSALSAHAPQDLRLVGLAGGSFRMGSDDPLAYPEDGEGPVREVTVAAFAIGPTAVSNAEFAAFVQATGYRTDAEIHGDSLVFSGLLEPALLASSPSVVGAQWWRRVEGATWFSPRGPGSSARGLADHPVTHVSLHDAAEYARWLGVRLPSEAEWEFAARGGLVGQPFPWGSVREPSGVTRMNTFHGSFPDAPTAPVGTMPVTAYPPNAYGLHNMTGNVWEWTSSRFSPTDPRAVMRGGSYLCHESYCRRYRTSARTVTTPDTSLGHTGFRIAVDC